MTSKEALEIIIFRLTSHEEDLELRETDKKAIEIIKQDLERLEVLEKENKIIKNSILGTTEIEWINENHKLKQENEKLKKAIALLNLLFNFEVDVETETIYCCLGDVSVNGANLIEDFELLKGVMNNEV